MGKALHVIGAAAVGFVAGILLAPKSGVETRKDIKNKALEAKEYAGEQAVKLREAATTAGKTMKKGLDEVNDEAKGMAKSAKSSAAVIAAEAARLGDEAKVRGNRVAEDAKRTADRVQKDAKQSLR
jgi:gas vesicle protein